ncbi:30S ribosomal protein S6 [Candidatus Daviesbacteria bacterium RIFCSPLOWO2_02_FULL_36_7]|uniref:Small ribosomal subunit protein bS6 n=1 Tax=Candidatus Daviesbacteria bacterium RIFCSPLOWO2_02_FULL_36_7 TaxID=1797792 RepID=A0A1F5MHL2_9BACT|nr:MAG: 30S ribosomal protein S6 [Candidatus Daviesbacteria bacterium RIFCSPLOWO2_02_FULL_36_7]
MNNYNLTLVLKPGLEEKARLELLESLKKKFAKVEKEDLWGQRSLAYPIKKQTLGYYVHFVIEAEPKIAKELDKTLRSEEDILRYLFVRV